MNLYFVLGGTIGVLGGMIHGIFGDRWTVACLRSEAIGSEQNTGEQNKRYLRWFWHIGTMVLVSTSALFLVAGLGLYDVAAELLWFASFQWLSITALFFVVAGQSPSQIKAMPPGLVGIPVNLLFLAGLLG